ncbi:hypothetical protein ACIQMR_33455 [Streptomyces sp. NPDC091376]|uniref:hypothetical protein n=1 Tax=Streptomyces sp. NPDC091376 TaxID=3365994 RepID=UPI0037FC783D
MEELLRVQNKRWLELFWKWLPLQDGVGLGRDFRKVAHDCRLHGFRKGLSAEAKEVWDAWVGKFREDCGRLRVFLADVMKASELAAGGKATRQRVLRERTRILREGRKSQHANLAVTAEAVMLSYTMGCKPRFAELYQGFCDTAKKSTSCASTLGSCLELLESRYTRILTEEARLRELCRELQEEGGQESRERNVPRLEASFRDYLHAWEELGQAVKKACVKFYKWAQDEAEKKMREEFASAFPAVHAVLVVAGALIAALRLGLLACSSTPLMPATLPVLAGLAVAWDVVQELIRRAVAAAATHDPETVREHVGVSYDYAGTHTSAKENLAEGADHAVRNNARGITIARPLNPQALFLGELAGVAYVAKGIHDQFNTKVLRPDADREELVALYDHAREHIHGSGYDVPDADVTPDADGRTVIDGVPGTITHGRFHETDRSKAFLASVRAWLRTQTGGLAMLEQRYVLQGPSGAADLATFADPGWVAHEEGEGGFDVRAVATWKRSVSPVWTAWYQAGFFLSYEGTVARPVLVFTGTLSTPAGCRVFADLADVSSPDQLLAFDMAEFDSLRENHGWTGSTDFQVCVVDGVTRLKDENGDVLSDASGSRLRLEDGAYVFDDPRDNHGALAEP